MNSDLLKYYRHLKETAALRSALSLLQWDQEVNLPDSAANSRANQISILSGLVHQKYTDKEFINLINKLCEATNLTELEEKSVRKTLKSVTKNTLLSTEFVENVSSVTSRVFNSWLDARKNNNANNYLKTLQKLVDIKKREYELKYPEMDIYEGCLDEYDEGLKTSELDRLFANLLPGIDQIIINVIEEEDDFQFLNRHYPADKQWNLGLEILNLCGFNFRAGRQDKSAHPFTITISEGDIRITTRIDENNFSEMFWSSMHELGHGLYEQGIPQEFEGAPESEACSISIHESQSRFWENHIGRSYDFINLIYPKLQETFPEQLKDVDSRKMLKAINRIKPGLIRTSADELTYHKHIFIRYTIEKELMQGKIHCSELKDIWNSMYESELGIKVPDDNHGVLQDVHWSHGSFGYFPTYTLGSLYAAQFNKQIRKEIPSVFNTLNIDSFSEIISWLSKNVYSKGRLFDSSELCQQITGNHLSADAFLDYSRQKFTHSNDKTLTET